MITLKELQDNKLSSEKRIIDTEKGLKEIAKIVKDKKVISLLRKFNKAGFIAYITHVDGRYSVFVGNDQPDINLRQFGLISDDQWQMNQIGGRTIWNWLEKDAKYVSPKGKIYVDGSSYNMNNDYVIAQLTKLIQLFK